MEIIKKWNQISLIKRIIVGMVVGLIIALTLGTKAAAIGILGNLFVGALRAVAPILVFFLVLNALGQHKVGHQTNMKKIIFLYLIGTFFASLIAVIASFIFKLEIVLAASGETEVTAPGGIAEVLKNLLMNIVDNPVNALMSGNFIGILTWALLLGFALRHASDGTKQIFSDISDALSKIVQWVISLAPFGIMGIVYNNITTAGLSALVGYGKLIILLVGVMFFVALVVNPIIVYIFIRKNPYPLVLKTLKDSGITAFFTRSSAANIPINMKLCRELKLDPDTYSVSIPLGATINMGGAAVTIAILSLAAANTLGVSVDFPTALILSVLAAACACGASGVAGGSLLLIPLACSLFGIPLDVAMKVVGVGFIIGVIQDSCETALNSSTDVLFTATAEFSEWRKEGKELPY